MASDLIAQARAALPLGQWSRVESCCRQVLQSDDEDADAWELLGEACEHECRLDESAECFRRAIRFRPQQPGLHLRLGNVLGSLSRLDEAAAAFDGALQLQPDDAGAILGLGITLGQLGRTAEAIERFRQAVKLHPNLPQAHHNLGVALAQTNQPDEAIACFEQAIRIKRDYAEAHANLGNVLSGQGRDGEAVEAYRLAISNKPDYADAYNSMGLVLSKIGEHSQAEVYLRHALRYRPDSANTHNNLGLALCAGGNFDAAIAAHQRALELDRANVEAHVNLGNAYRHQGQLGKAIASYEIALAHQPDRASARWNLSLALLQSGDFERGFREYEWRWNRDHLEAPKFPQPRWDGKPLDGKTILLYGEQGLGDMIQFIRYASLVQELGGKVIVRCAGYLKPIVSRCRGVDAVVMEEESLPAFDVHAAMMSLPGLLGTTLDNVPGSVPYITPDPQLVEQWRDALPADDKLNVGITWQGNPHHAWDHYRSVPLQQFALLAQLPDVRIVSLQRTHGLEQLETVGPDFSITVYPEELDRTAGAFMDTAAIMMNLDLVITIDSALAHLGGALGRPTWVALSTVHDWRWLTQRSDSPWYPTMRLFRQSNLGDWDKVVREIAVALAMSRSTRV